jgi:hypothetical protein
MEMSWDNERTAGRTNHGLFVRMFLQERVSISRKQLKEQVLLHCVVELLPVFMEFGIEGASQYQAYSGSRSLASG